MTTPGPLLYAIDDLEAQFVAELVEQGWDQRAASRLVYAAPAFDDEWPLWLLWIRGTVQILTADLRKLVGLP